MNTAVQKIELEIPQVDLSFLRKLVKNIGWTMKKTATSKLSAYEQALDDVKQGRISEYNSLDEFIKEIEGKQNWGMSYRTGLALDLDTK